MNRLYLYVETHKPYGIVTYNKKDTLALTGTKSLVYTMSIINIIVEHMENVFIFFSNLEVCIRNNNAPCRIILNRSVPYRTAKTTVITVFYTLGISVRIRVQYIVNILITGIR